MARFEGISNELFELVVVLLDLKSILNLRLVSHTISAKTNQNTFQSFFKTIRVRLTLADLKAFEKATRSAFFGNFVKNITLVGIVHDLDQLNEIVRSRLKERIIPGGGRTYRNESCSDDELSQAEQDLARLRRQHAEWTGSQEDGTAVSLLRAALDSIDAQPRGLERLSFELEDALKLCDGLYVEQSPYITMEKNEAASEALFLGLSALQQSKLKRVNALDIYSTNVGSIGFAIPIDVLSYNLDRIATAHDSVLPCVRSLSVAYTFPRCAILGGSGADWFPGEIETKLEQDGPFFGHTQLLLVCCNIEELRVTHCGPPLIRTSWGIAKYCEYDLIDRQIRHLIEYVKLSRLRKLYLSGMSFEDNNLAKLLLGVSNSLESLVLRSVDIKGSLTAGLGPITGGDCLRVDRLSLENLQQDSFDVIWDRDLRDQAAIFDDENDTPWGEFIRRHGKDVRRPLLYSLNTRENESEDDGCFPLWCTFD